MSKAETDALQYRTKRLETFTEGVKIGNSKTAKQWTLALVDVNHLADLGFYYSPTRKFPNQITCFWCGKKEKNLEAVLSVTEFHMSNSPQCPYALIASNLEKFVMDSDKETFWQRLAKSGTAPASVLHPHSIPSTQLRQSTFKKLWKYDKRRKCKVTSRGLAKAGFYYSPLDTSSDRVICMYCDCPLEEWDSSDDPLEEHKNNSFTYCYFLETIGKEPLEIAEFAKETLVDPKVSQGDIQSDADDQDRNTFENSINESPMNLSIQPQPSGTPSPTVTHKRTTPSNFDAFDFSVEDLENHELATIFNNKKVQDKKPPRRYLKRSELQKFPAVKEKARLADSGMSLVLEINQTPDAGENGEKEDISNDLAIEMHGQDAIDDLSFQQSHAVSYPHDDSKSTEVIVSSLTTKEPTSKVPSYSDSFDLSVSENEEVSEFTPSFSSSTLSPKKKLDTETKKRKISLSRAELAKKKRQKSLFSDDDDLGLNQAQLEEILNSPRKERKMKVIKANVEASPAPAIYDMSNQNIGDYEEENISFLEKNIQVKTDKANTKYFAESKIEIHKTAKVITDKQKEKRTVKKSLQDQLDDMVKDNSRTIRKRRLNTPEKVEFESPKIQQRVDEASVSEVSGGFPTTSTPTKEFADEVKSTQNFDFPKDADVLIQNKATNLAEENGSVPFLEPPTHNISDVSDEIGKVNNKSETEDSFSASTSLISEFPDGDKTESKKTNTTLSKDCESSLSDQDMNNVQEKAEDELKECSPEAPGSSMKFMSSIPETAVENESLEAPSVELSKTHIEFDEKEVNFQNTTRKKRSEFDDSISGEENDVEPVLDVVINDEKKTLDNPRAKNQGIEEMEVDINELEKEEPMVDDANSADEAEVVRDRVEVADKHVSDESRLDDEEVAEKMSPNRSRAKEKTEDEKIKESDDENVPESTFNVEDQSEIKNVVFSPFSYHEYVKDMRDMEKEFDQVSVLEETRDAKHDYKTFDASSGPSVIEESVSELPILSSGSPFKGSKRPNHTAGDDIENKEQGGDDVNASLEETDVVKATGEDDDHGSEKPSRELSRYMRSRVDSYGDKSLSPPSKIIAERRFPISSPRKLMASSVGDFEEQRDLIHNSMQRLSFTDIEASTPQKKLLIISQDVEEEEKPIEEQKALDTQDYGNGVKEQESIENHGTFQTKSTGVKLPQLKLENVAMEIQTLLETIEYLSEVSATQRELHNDAEGLLTQFIAAMPEEEESMSIREWMQHNAATCGRTVRDISERIIQSYEESFDQVIEYIKKMDTWD